VLYRLRDAIARACMFLSAVGGRWTSAAARGSTTICPNDNGWRYLGCYAHFAGFGVGSSVAYWKVGDQSVLSLDKDVSELSVLPDMPQGELHAPECRGPLRFQLAYPSFFFERTHHFIDQIKSLQSISRIQSGAT
jgi:hypothetical protein